MSKLSTWAATVGLCLFALPSCSPEIVERWHTQYVYQDVHHRDTLVTKDSVYIREYVKGDTVYIEKYKDRFVYYIESFQNIQPHFFKEKGIKCPCK